MRRPGRGDWLRGHRQTGWGGGVTVAAWGSLCDTITTTLCSCWGSLYRQQIHPTRAGAGPCHPDSTHLSPPGLAAQQRCKHSAPPPSPPAAAAAAASSPSFSSPPTPPPPVSSAGAPSLPPPSPSRGASPRLPLPPSLPAVVVVIKVVVVCVCVGHPAPPGTGGVLGARGEGGLAIVS